MGLAEDLGYQHSNPGPVRRRVRQLFSSPAGSTLARVTLRPLDALVRRLSGDRVTITRAFSGLATLWLTTTGAKSGLPREVPLIGIPCGTGIAVLGTYYGHEATPAWVYNLEADPDASLSFGGRTILVRARPATEQEEGGVWEAAARIYPGYAGYRQRAAHRKIRVLVLEMRESP